MARGQSSANLTSSSSDQKSLRAIADLIGCPVEIFDPGSGISHPLLEAGELLDLWTRISRDDDRLKVLDLARRLARM